MRNNFSQDGVQLQPSTDERGQVTVLLLAAIVLAAMIAVGLAIVSEAMVHRMRARNAADAVALASASDPAAADTLARWYGQQGVDVSSQTVGRATARSGPSQAAAWAQSSTGTVERSPALVAIMARAEQLLGYEFTALQWHTHQVTVPEPGADLLASIAVELFLCEGASEPESGRRAFRICERP